MYYPGEQSSPSSQVFAEGGEGSPIMYTQAAPTLVQAAEAKTPSVIDSTPNYTIPGTNTLLPLPAYTAIPQGFTNNFAWPSQDAGAKSRERVYAKYYDPIADKIPGLIPPDYYALQLMRENPNPAGWSSAFNNIVGIELQVVERYLNQPALVAARGGETINLVNTPQGQAIIAAGQNAAVQHHANITRQSDEGYLWQEMPALTYVLAYYGAAFPDLVFTPGQVFRSAVDYAGVPSMDDIGPLDFDEYPDVDVNVDIGPLDIDYSPSIMDASPDFGPLDYGEVPSVMEETVDFGPLDYDQVPSSIEYEVGPLDLDEYPATGDVSMGSQMPPAVNPELEPEKVFNEPEPPAPTRFPEISTSDLGRAFNVLRQIYSENQGTFRQGLQFLNQQLAAEGKPSVPAATILQQRPPQNISVRAQGSAGRGITQKSGLNLDAIGDTIQAYALPIGAALVLAFALSRRRH